MPDTRELPVTVSLDRAEATDLAVLLSFLADWLEGSDTGSLAASLDRFTDASGYGVTDLLGDLGYFTALLSTPDPSPALSPVVSVEPPPRLTA